jgi:CRP-like cAMP-binding protein
MAGRGVRFHLQSEGRAALVPTSSHPADMLVRKLGSIARLSDEERRAVMRLPMTIRPLPGGHDIVCEHDRPMQCCLILDGWASRYQLLAEGRRQIFSFHVPGDIPDLQSLHLRVMDHSLCALTPVTLAFVPHEAIRDLTTGYPGIAATLWRDTLVDGAIFREWMVGMGRRSAYQAVAHLFCETYVKLEAVGLAENHRYRLPVMQVDIADALGLSNVHVNRVLRQLREENLLALRNGWLNISNWPELAKIGEFDPLYLHVDRLAA